MTPEPFDDLDLAPIAGSDRSITTVPTVDLQAFLCDRESTGAKEAVDAIAEAAANWGFFQVINHGIDIDRVNGVWEQTADFFSLPLDQKLSIVRTQENPWGFYNNELTKNQRDKKEVFDFTRAGVDPIYGQTNRWPQGSTSFRNTMETWLDSSAALSLELLDAFCLGLDLPAGYLRPQFSEHSGFVRLNFYPTADPLAGAGEEELPAADLGIHHHTDAGALTVLLQDQVGGLQVYHNGFWHNVDFVGGALVINTGDMMQVWSNDRYRAAIHRVLAMDTRERYSIPFFFNPNAHSRVTPLPSVVDDANPGAYREILWSEFRGKRSKGDFADYGTEIQIAQYRLAESGLA